MKELQRIGTSSKNLIDSFKEGVSLEQRTGATIDQLCQRACCDRYKFAIYTLKSARRAMSQRPAQYRLAIGRAYYAMYHAVRSVVFLIEGGDDHEKHAELPLHIPKDFPDRDKWMNALKGARLDRNRADYDPYPMNAVSMRADATNTIVAATSLMPVVKAYLTSKGVAL